MDTRIAKPHNIQLFSNSNMKKIDSLRNFAYNKTGY